MSRLSAQVAKALELQLGNSPSNEYSGMLSFRIDWLDPLAVQETPKSLLQQVQKYQFFGFDILSISLTESPQLCQLLTRESACSLKL